jgi:hypothetical protein
MTRAVSLFLAVDTQVLAHKSGASIDFDTEVGC